MHEPFTDAAATPGILSRSQQLGRGRLVSHVLRYVERQRHPLDVEVERAPSPNYDSLFVPDTRHFGVHRQNSTYQ